MDNVIEGAAETISVTDPEDPDWLIDELPNPYEMILDQEDWWDVGLDMDSVFLSYGSGNDGGN